MSSVVFGLAWVLVTCSANAQTTSATKPAQTRIAPTDLMSRQKTYTQYCAACHGAAGKGDGPAAHALKISPADLSTLAKRHGGEFPTAYVTSILLFGPGVPAHGATNMPIWGPLFQIVDKQDGRAVEQRIKNLCDYLATLQQK